MRAWSENVTSPPGPRTSNGALVRVSRPGRVQTPAAWIVDGLVRSWPARRSRAMRALVWSHSCPVGATRSVVELKKNPNCGRSCDEAVSCARRKSYRRGSSRNVRCTPVLGAHRDGMVITRHGGETHASRGALRGVARSRTRDPAELTAVAWLREDRCNSCSSPMERSHPPARPVERSSRKDIVPRQTTSFPFGPRKLRLSRPPRLINVAACQVYQCARPPPRAQCRLWAVARLTRSVHELFESTTGGPWAEARRMLRDVQHAQVRETKNENRTDSGERPRAACEMMVMENTVLRVVLLESKT